MKAQVRSLKLFVVLAAAVALLLSGCSTLSWSTKRVNIGDPRPAPLKLEEWGIETETLEDSEDSLVLQLRVSEQTRQDQEQRVRVVETGKHLTKKEFEPWFAGAALSGVTGATFGIGYLLYSGGLNPERRAAVGIGTLGLFITSGVLALGGGIHAAIMRHPPTVATKFHREVDTIRGEVLLEPAPDVGVAFGASSYGPAGEVVPTSAEGYVRLQLSGEANGGFPDRQVVLNLQQGDRKQTTTTDLAGSRFFGSRFGPAVGQLLIEGQVETVRRHLLLLSADSKLSADLLQPYCEGAKRVFDSGPDDTTIESWSGFGEEEWMPKGGCTSARISLAVGQVRRAVTGSPPHSRAAQEVLKTYGNIPGATARMQDAWCESVSGRFRKAVDKKSSSEAAAYSAMPVGSDGCKKRWNRLAPRIESRARRALKKADYSEVQGWAKVLSKAPPSYWRKASSLERTANERSAIAEERAAAREEARLRARYKKVVDTWQGRIARALASCNSYHQQAQSKRQKVYTLINNYDSRAEREAEAFNRWLDRTENGSLATAKSRLDTIFEEMEEAESYGHDTQLRRKRLKNEHWRCQQGDYEVGHN